MLITDKAELKRFNTNIVSGSVCLGLHIQKKDGRLLPFIQEILTKPTATML